MSRSSPSFSATASGSWYRCPRCLRTGKTAIVRIGEFWRCSMPHAGVEIAQWGATQADAFENTMAIIDLLPNDQAHPRAQKLMNTICKHLKPSDLCGICNPLLVQDTHKGAIVAFDCRERMITIQVDEMPSGKEPGHRLGARAILVLLPDAMLSGSEGGKE